MSDRTMLGYGGTSGASMSGVRTIVALTSGSSTPQTIAIGPTLNAPRLDFRGGKVRIEALVDHEGLAELQSSLAALHTLMQPKTADDIAADQARQAARPDPFAWR